MAVGRPLGAKLFIEGIEVPFLGASFVHTVGQASIAYIDVVPHKSINNIKPRTHVQISVRDYNNPKDDYPFVHAWDGEVFGIAFGKTPSSRSFSLSCIDVSSYWDNVLSYFINPMTSLGKGGNHMTGVGLDIVTAEKSGIKVVAAADSLSSLLWQTIKNETKGKDFLAGFAKLYDTIGLVNSFYSAAEKRLRIYDRITLRSSGKLNQLLDQSQALKWFEGIVGQMGGFTTLRTVVQELMGTIFHDFTSVPFAAKVEITEESKGDKYKEFKSVYADSQNKKYTVGQFLLKPNLFMIAPPVCNVFFPDEYSNFQYSRNFFKEPTRLIYKPELPQFLNAGNVSLGYQFEPPSYQNFMIEKREANDEGADDLAAADIKLGKYGSKDESPSKVTNNSVLREGQFLTKEEQIKGVWMAIESMMPAATAFTLDGGDSSDKLKFIRQISKYLFFKKRFENRSLQITSHLKLSVVPGFNILLLDDSDANQSTLAYCSSVTHRIFATDGGYTNVQLSYARTVDEEKTASNNGNDPVIPPWFDENTFGVIKKAAKVDRSSAAKIEAGNRGPQYTAAPFAALSTYYKALLGDKGYRAITDYYPAESTLFGSVSKLLEDYRSRKRQGSEILQDFIAEFTGRDYIRTRHFFKFLGASLPETKQGDSNVSRPYASKKESTPLVSDLRNSEFNVFSGGAFDENDTTFGSSLRIKLKIIRSYQDVLKTLRGFRG